MDEIDRLIERLFDINEYIALQMLELSMYGVSESPVEMPLVGVSVNGGIDAPAKKQQVEYDLLLGEGKQGGLAYQINQ